MKSTLVLQKEIIDDLFIRQDEFEPFIKFLKKNFRNYDLIVNHVNDDEFKLHSQENPLIELLLDKLDSITFIENLEDILKENKISNYCSLRTVVLCNLDDAHCNNQLEKSGILYFNMNSLGKWNSISEIIYSKSLKVSSDSNIPNNYKFSGWSDLAKHLKYCNSILIFDRYIFGNKSNQRLVNNLYPLIENILVNNKNHVNLTIISEFENKMITTHHDLLQNHLKDKGLNNFTVNLIHHTKAFYPRNFEGIHSRFIISNYVHILSNDSFNFFKENGSINNLADVDIKFSLTTMNKFSYQKDLENIKTYISRTKNEPNSPNSVLKYTFFKTKINPLLN